MTATDNAMSDISPLRDFVIAMTHLVSKTQDEPVLLREGRALLAPLLADDRWLPEACAVLRQDRYAQYLLHADPLERFSVVSFVWGPGHRTPVHDHTVWGLVGMLRGQHARGQTIAFGPFLALGGWIALLWRDTLVALILPGLATA